ncbi:MAG: hypothetical protein J6330_10605 [Clostridia bacterium]|nr:hypothetical protein [Clostridia bacterium]
MKKNYDYEKIEERVRSGMAGAERGLVYEKKQTEARPAENTGRRSVFGSIGMQVAGAFLAAAIVGGATFGALKYAEYRGSMIAPGSDPGIDSVYTEYGSVTSFYEDVQPGEPAENFTFRGVTVIDTDKVTEDELKTDLPLDHYYVSVRGVISETAEKAGYEVFTYKLAAGEGVCVTKGGKLVFDRASPRDISRVPSRLIVADETPSGHGMIFFTQYFDTSGLYGGMTSVFAYDTVTGESAPVEVFLLDDDPVSAGIKSSPGAVGYYGDAVIGYDENTGFINYQETFDPIYADSTDRAGEALLSNPYRLGYINGKYVIGMPIEDDDYQPADTTLPSPDEPDKNVCFFKEVTVIDPAADGIVTDPDLPPQLEDDGTVAEIRNEHVSELGYGIYADGERLIIADKDGTGVVKVFGRGDGLFPLIIAETDHRQPDGGTFGQLIVTEDKDTGKVTFIHTRFAMYSGLYGGTTLIEYFDTQTRETGAIRVYLPESAVEYSSSGGYLGTYELTKLSAEDTANGKTIGCTCTIVPIGRGNNETQEDFFAGYLRYDNGNYYFGEPYDIGDDGADTTGTGTDTAETDPDPDAYNATGWLRVTGVDANGVENTVFPPVIGITSDISSIMPHGNGEGVPTVRCCDAAPLIQNTIRMMWKVYFVTVNEKTFDNIESARAEIQSLMDAAESELSFFVTVGVSWDRAATVPDYGGVANVYVFGFHIEAERGAQTFVTETEPVQTEDPSHSEEAVTTGPQQTEPVQTDAPDSYTEKLEAAAAEIGGWLGGRLHEGMDLTELLGSIGDVKGDGLSLKKRWMAGDRIDSTAAGGTVRASAEEDAYYFLCITEEDPDARYPVIETRLIMYPGAGGLELPFGLTPDTSAENALQALGLSGFDGKASAAANVAKISVSGGAGGVVKTCAITDGDSFISEGFELGFGRSSQIYVEMSK